METKADAEPVAAVPAPTTAEATSVSAAATTTTAVSEAAVGTKGEAEKRQEELDIDIDLDAVEHFTELEPLPKRVTRSASAAAATAVVLGGREFKTAFELQAFIHDVIHERYMVDQELDAADFAVALDVLRHHPNADAKIGASGVRAIAVRMHPSFSNRCLTLLRNDGSSEDFSAARCVEAIFSLKPPPHKQNRVLIEAPGVVVKFNFAIIPNEPAATAAAGAGAGGYKQDEERRPSREAMAAIKKQMLAAIAKAVGVEESAIHAIDVLRLRPLAFVRMCDKEAAEKVVAVLRNVKPSMSFVADDWSVRAEVVEVASGDDEKVFWERVIKGRELSRYARRGGISSGRGYGYSGRSRGVSRQTAALPDATGKTDSEPNVPSAVPATTTTTTTANVTATATTPTNALLPLPTSPGMVVVPKQQTPLPKKAPRVTPTEGQTKRPATAVGTVGRPPVVVSKRAKTAPTAPADPKLSTQ